MKVCNVDHAIFYQVLNAAFQARQVHPRVIELGVLRGDNALKLKAILAPSHLVLVDSWSATLCETYSAFDTLPAWVKPLESFADYFGGPLHDQRTFDQLHQACVAKFQGMPDVTILRSGTSEALMEIRRLSGPEPFDLIYVDANHQYEFVLRDLMLYQELAGPESVLMLNDCCFSPAGTQQNLGVLEAVGSFIKRTDFTPVALTNNDWSDAILVRKGSHMERLIDRLLVDSNVAFVDIPPQLLAAARVLQGSQAANLSFA